MLNFAKFSMLVGADDVNLTESPGQEGDTPMVIISVKPPASNFAPFSLD